MFRNSILTAMGLALTLAWGGAAMAQQLGADAAGQTAGATEAEVGAPMEEETGVKGVYSLKGMMGLSAGAQQDEAAAGAEAEAQAGAEDETAAETAAEGEEPASN